MGKVRTRFAPSPTGRMHVGNLRTALYASKIEIFEPEQIALILYPLKDCFKIRDTGEYRGYEKIGRAHV